jgi:hypothetical protein
MVKWLDADIPQIRKVCNSIIIRGFRNSTAENSIFVSVWQVLWSVALLFQRRLVPCKCHNLSNIFNLLPACPERVDYSGLTGGHMVESQVEHQGWSYESSPDMEEALSWRLPCSQSRWRNPAIVCTGVWGYQEYGMRNRTYLRGRGLSKSSRTPQRHWYLWW